MKGLILSGGKGTRLRLLDALERRVDGSVDAESRIEGKVARHPLVTHRA